MTHCSPVPAIAVTGTLPLRRAGDGRMVRLVHVSKSYPSGRVLLDVDLTIGVGELVVICGPSGSGKSTLMRLLLGLTAPTRGWITVDGVTLSNTAPGALATHRRRIGVIPQGATLVPEMTVLENVALGLEVAGSSAKDARQGAALSLERLSLTRLSDRPVGFLSAGERKWVTIARALAREEAPLILADEPIADLESIDAQAVAELLHNRRCFGVTVVVSSQQPGLPGLAEQRVVMLDRGRITLDSGPLEQAQAC